jgi:glycosyltransferase involved in cell wall biosynthesis
MRILHWYPNFQAGGGVANAVLGLAFGQARLRAEVLIAAVKSSNGPLYEPMQVEEVRLVEWVPSRTVRIRGTCLRQPCNDDLRRLQATKPDLVHVHGEMNPDNLWVARLFNCPIILSPHGAFHPEVFKRRGKTARSLYFQMAKLVLYRYVRAFHALCEAEREHIVRVLPHAQVYCVPEGPNVRAPVAFSPRPPADENGRVRFVFVGRLDVFTKGLDILLEAFAEAGRVLRGPGIVLTLVGPDWRRSMTWLKHRAHELGIGDRVTMTGAVPGRGVALILQQADVYVQLSRHDGFGLSVSEALLAGKPAILSDAIGTTSYHEVAFLPHVRIIPPRIKEATCAIADFAHRLPELRRTAEQHQGMIREFFSWVRIAGLQLNTYDQIRRD